MDDPLVGIVGPCASGKTTLAAGLKLAGYRVRHIAQEHSYVADMWKRITNPDVLIYLDVSYPLTLVRRKMDWTEKEYDEQLFRLRNARQNAHLMVDTNPLTAQQVFELVVAYLKTRE